ncbi:acetyl-CoA C-acetyltransferase [Malassezia cuniculi]|uniref:acetyl-CoA C-acetyltransferase n=1 Tax=Malassezia cuniculi TaxID=948313 RepID=A0AAF0EX17_9BASI|nr:acetyl-CoA C-acetyltransferase [Malassezia cuniculi]
MAVFIVAGARTPVGAFNGALKSVSAPDLFAVAAKSAIEKSGLAASDVEEAYVGCVLQGGVGQAPARQAVLAAGCPDTTEATTINKVCASGIKAIALAASSIALGDRKIMLAGGMESMSLAPVYLTRGITFGDTQARDAILADGLLDAGSKSHMGIFAEQTAKSVGVSREEQDAYALSSYERAEAAWSSGVFKEEVVPVTIKHPKGDTVVAVDEEYSRLQRAKVPTLRPAFAKDGTITAANASSLSDGAAAVVLAGEDTVRERGLAPLARIVATADAAIAPSDFATAPSQAIPRALARAGLTTDDIALWEINEAFAVVAVANMRLLGLDPAKVNTRGGAVSLGHPLGMSGTRIVVTLAHALKQGEYGVAAICNGGGAASAIVIQRV